MSQRAVRMAVPAVAAVAALLAGCARLPVAGAPSAEERFANAYIELLPVGALMDHSAANDPRWPLGDKADLLSERQMVCMRQALTSNEVDAAQRQLAQAYAQAHLDTLAADLDVLEGGAARLIGQAMRQGAGLRVAERPPTADEARALAAFATDARYANLRQATGLERLAGGAPAAANQRGKDISNVLTVKFLTDAFLRCHIPVKLLY